MAELETTGAPVAEPTMATNDAASLACAGDPAQVLKTLPLALRHHVAGPLVRKLRAAFKPSA